MTTVIQNPANLKRGLAAAGLLSLLAFTTGCPSEPTSSVDSSVNPPAVNIEEGSSVVDEVQVMSETDAMDEAIQEIDESNVLDALEQLEKDMGSGN